jgi:hypothetical protein
MTPNSHLVLCALARERGNDLLREAEQTRLERQAGAARPGRLRSRRRLRDAIAGVRPKGRPVGLPCGPVAPEGVRR